MIDITFDTNILFYAFDPADARKHSIAKNILANCYDIEVPISLQCLSEFYRSATRKQLVSPIQAAAIVTYLSKGMSIIQPGEIDLLAAMHIHQQYSFQFFDCLLAATVARAGCATLFSEDFQHNRTIGTLKIVNPFLITTQELDSLLA